VNNIVGRTTTEQRYKARITNYDEKWNKKHERIEMDYVQKFSRRNTQNEFQAAHMSCHFQVIDEVMKTEFLSRLNDKLGGREGFWERAKMTAFLISDTQNLVKSPHIGNWLLTNVMHIA
jgi:hypothetical protein